jgi:hypothetical protein
VAAVLSPGVTSAAGSSAVAATLSSTTTHAPNVSVSIAITSHSISPVKKYKLGSHYYAGCSQKACGDFVYGYSPAALSFKPSPGEYFVYGRGGRKYTFPAGSPLASCTVDTWYGGALREHDVTVCGQKHGELVLAYASLWRS